MYLYDVPIVKCNTYMFKCKLYNNIGLRQKRSTRIIYLDNVNLSNLKIILVYIFFKTVIKRKEYFNIIVLGSSNVPDNFYFGVFVI